MIADPWFYATAIPAVLIFGLAKGGFGGGIAVISVPLMSLTVPPLQAAAIMLPLLIAMDAVAVWTFRGSFSRVHLKMIIPGALLGVFVGALSFQYLSEDAVRIMVGAIAVAFCLHYWIGREPASEPKPSLVKGSIWGGIAGFTSFGIHAGGPPVSIYLLPQRMEKTVLMGTFAIFFAVVNLVKLLPYGWQGQLATGNLMTSLVLMPLAPVGVRLGYYLLNKVSEALIYRLCYFFLFVVGLKLLWDGVMPSS